jgi:hypothetical protein
MISNKENDSSSSKGEESSTSSSSKSFTSTSVPQHSHATALAAQAGKNWCLSDFEIGKPVSSASRLRFGNFEMVWGSTSGGW